LQFSQQPLLTDEKPLAMEGETDWIADFGKAAPARRCDPAAAEYGFRPRGTAAGDIPSVRAVFVRPMFLEDRYLNHPYYDPLWAELERLGITAAGHATAELWNPEWTSPGPFFEKIKDRLVQPIAPGGGGGPFAGGSGGAILIFEHEADVKSHAGARGILRAVHLITQSVWVAVVKRARYSFSVRPITCRSSARSVRLDVPGGDSASFHSAPSALRRRRRIASSLIASVRSLSAPASSASAPADSFRRRFTSAEPAICHSSFFSVIIIWLTGLPLLEFGLVLGE
jgi:hypothetical protein